jgi:hypothetical protein
LATSAPTPVSFLVSSILCTSLVGCGGEPAPPAATPHEHAHANEPPAMCLLLARTCHSRPATCTR